MQLTVQGKQMDVGEALRTHVSDKLEDLNNKYFNRAIDATVTLSPEGSAFTKTHISIRVGKDIMVMSDATETDPYISFDAAADKVAKQLRRYKKMLRDHHERIDETPEAEIMKARDYVLATTGPEAVEQDNEEQNADDNPLVIAEMITNIQSMSVSEAVMRLELSGSNALMFRNSQHEGLNMIYRREDGNIGWVDPEGNQNH